MILILTPSFNLLPGGDPATEPQPVLDHFRAIGATFCFPHQCVTDALIDKPPALFATSTAIPG